MLTQHTARLAAAVTHSRCLYRSASTAASRIIPHSDWTVFQEFTGLAVRHDAVNLGQGFPGWGPPEWLVSPHGLSGTPQQYTAPKGEPHLAKQLASQYECEQDEEVAVVSGATGGIFAVFQALLEPGDEVVLMEPSYDCYAPAVELAGGVVKRVSLHKAGASTGQGSSRAPIGDVFGLNKEALAAAITPKTRAVMLNTPHNPTGLCFAQDELDALADVLADHERIVLVTDEVYDRLCLQPQRPLVRAAKHPSLRDRTVTISSVGKSLACTGWKVGWVVGPSWLIDAVAVVTQWSQFCVATPLQYLAAQALQLAPLPLSEAAERSLSLPGVTQQARDSWQSQGEQEIERLGLDASRDSFYDLQVAQYRERQDALVSGLEAAGLPPLVPDAGFFVLADISSVLDRVPDRYRTDASPARRISKPAPGVPGDWAFSRWLTEEAGVACIPVSAFYSADTEHQGAHLARFAFCKPLPDIQQAMQRLQEFLLVPERA